MCSKELLDVTSIQKHFCSSKDMDSLLFLSELLIASNEPVLIKVQFMIYEEASSDDDCHSDCWF